MNYLVELNMFDDWVETEDISPNAILLWRTLMSVANRSGWKEEFTVSLSTLESRTKLHKATVCRVRDELMNKGLLSYESRGGRLSAAYRLHSFELRGATQSDSREIFDSPIVSHTATQNDNQTDFELHSATQNDGRSEFVSHSASQSENIYKLNNISLDKKDKDDFQVKKKSKEPTHEAGAETSSLGYALREGGRRSQKSCAEKEKAGIDLSFVGDPVWEEMLRTWLEYKQGRNQSYKSDLSVKKFLTMLRNLSRGDPATAQKIIDKSIANNWAGVFELTEAGSQPPNRPATGQRIGQIKQPEDEARRQQLLQKFDSKNKPK